MQHDGNAIYPPFFARFYDLIYDRIREGVDTEYFLEKIRNTEGPVLEIGAGTGRFFLRALNEGADIDGIDISPSMLDILKERLDPKHRHRVTLQDILSFSTIRKYSLIIAPFRVFMHLISTEEHLQALDHVYGQLMPGGIFIFDLYIPDPGMLANGIEDKIDFEGEYAPGETIRRITSAKNDLIMQINHVTFRFEWTENYKWYSETWNTEMRFFFRYELEYLLILSKFKETHIYGDFKESPLTAGSKEFVVVCTK